MQREGDQCGGEEKEKRKRGEGGRGKGCLQKRCRQRLRVGVLGWGGVVKGIKIKERVTERTKRRVKRGNCRHDFFCAGGR